jgi:hypothetical protein
MRWLTALLSVAILAGCAKHATLAIHSQPPGAYLTEVGTGLVLGTAPAASYYKGDQLQNYKDAQGCYVVKGVEARWVSGARAVTDPVRLCGSSTGTYSITLTRDTSHPNLEKDLQFALQLEAVRAQQQQARAAQDAAESARILAETAKNRANRSISCSSFLLGDIVQTTCQ